MRKVGIKISVCMGVTLSFILSLAGTLTSGHFTVPLWIGNFLLSAAISIVLGLLIPIGLVNKECVEKAGLEPHTLPARLLETLISNLIFTPLVSFIMVYLAWQNIVLHAPADMVPPFPVMFFRSFVMCFVIGYIAIFIVQPIYVKLFIPKGGMPQGDGRREGAPEH